MFTLASSFILEHTLNCRGAGAYNATPWLILFNMKLLSITFLDMEIKYDWMIHAVLPRYKIFIFWFSLVSVSQSYQTLSLAEFQTDKQHCLSERHICKNFVANLAN